MRHMYMDMVWQCDSIGEMVASMLVTFSIDDGKRLRAAWECHVHHRVPLIVRAPLVYQLLHDQLRHVHTVHTF